ncbi:hypothetical protein JCM17823_00220 [Halorubrum gandharaense]
MKRRTYLSIGVGGAVTGLSGCLSYFNPEVQIAGLEAGNETSQEQSIDFRVLDGDQQIQETEITLGPAEQSGENTERDDFTDIECEWDTEPRDFQLEARLDEEWKTVDVPSEADTDCVYVGIVIHVDGFLYFRVLSCDVVEEDDKICSTFENELEF